MHEIHIDQEKCVRCGICVSACPQSAIEVGADGIAKIGISCNFCSACIDKCPSQAISKNMIGINEVSNLDVRHLESCNDFWVIVELRGGDVAGCTFELLGEAHRLTVGTRHKVAAVLLCGDHIDKYARSLIAGGADIVYVVDNENLSHFRDGPFKETILHLVRERRPLALLLSATAMGRSLAPRLAANLHTGLSADCTKLELCENGLLIQTRPAFGGNLFASILCPHTWPQMATVRPKVLRPLEPDPARHGEVVENEYVPCEDQLLTEIIDFITQDSNITVDDADIIVTAGHGASKPEGLQLVSELAAVLKGAVGASRKVVDAGLIGYEHQVGQTGKTVGAKLYIACGVSGAIQHAVGMSSSKKIVAINIDKDAPIFHYADVGVVADLYQFLPKLITAVRRENSKSI